MKDGTDTRVEKTRSVGDVERPYAWCDDCSTKLFVGEARCCRCGAERSSGGTAPTPDLNARGRYDSSAWLSRAVYWADRARNEPTYHGGQWSLAAFYMLRVFLGVALLALAAPAAAQTDVDRLMRTAWSECGVECAPHEIAALHDVIAGIAERSDVRWSTAWRLASPRLAAGTVSRRWLAGITERCDEPEGWPRTDYVEADGTVRRAPRWSRWRERCAVLAANVRAVFAGEVVSQCSERPRSWGDSHDRERGEARGRAVFVEVDCGDTALIFGGWETR